MDAFEFRSALIEDYARFSRSFTQVKADDIRSAIGAIYDHRNRFGQVARLLHPGRRRGPQGESERPAPTHARDHPLPDERPGEQPARGAERLPLELR
jgi:hypothetical protein